MQDFDEVSLQLLLSGRSLAQHHQPFDGQVPALLRLWLAPVPAELLVNRLMVNVDEEGQAILRQA